jgi:hypothetical protein
VEIIQNSVGGCARHWAEVIADGLIAHGVTVQYNTEITDELLKQLRSAPLTVLHEEPTIEFVQEWISVKDRLPDNKEHDWVLAQVVEDNGFMHIPKVMEYRQQRNDWFEETYGWLSEHNGAFTVTHWMPLPQPPKGE